MRYSSSPSEGNPVIKSDFVTKMSSLERDNVVVFYNIIWNLKSELIRGVALKEGDSCIVIKELLKINKITLKRYTIDMYIHMIKWIILYNMIL